jgi:hypothetical protein
VDKRIILKCILKEQDGRMWTGFIWFSTRLAVAVVNKVTKLGVRQIVRFPAERWLLSSQE